MKLTRRDLPNLWLPAAAALLLFAIAGLLSWVTHSDAEKAERERNGAASARNQIEQRLRQVRTEEQEIKERTQHLLRLQKEGISGEERRLDWTETLRDAQRELGIQGMSYEFGVQSPLDTPENSAQAWFSSPMRLQLRLLHEEDLLRFLTRIQKSAKALVIVRSCKLAPISRPADGRESVLFSAECDMQWLTTRQPGATK